MRVLITGATGFAGGHLAEFCASRGDAVVGLGRRKPRPEQRDHLAEYLSADLTDPIETRRAIEAAHPEQVFHLAGAASAEASWDDLLGTFEANLFATLNLLEAVRQCDTAPPVLVACSAQEYGKPESLPITEDHPLRPLSPYGVAKAAGDQLAGLYAEAHGVRVVRTRAFNHAGPGQGAGYVVSDFARQIAEAEIFGTEGKAIVTTGNIATRRDFTDVRDVVRAYARLLEERVTGAFNVCSGHSVSVADLLSGLAESTPLEVEPRTDSALVRGDEVVDLRGSHEKLTIATGWRPEIPLDRTLADVSEWWRKRLFEQG